MRRVHGVILLVLVVGCLLVWAQVFLLREPDVQTDLPLPTLAVLPPVTPSSTSLPPTNTSSPIPTLQPFHTATDTPTLRPSPTATLAVRVLEIRAVMPGVELPPSPTPLPEDTILLAAPPEPVEPLPDATRQPPPYTGWVSFESDHPLVQYSPPWERRQRAGASRGQYHRTENTLHTVTFPFEGEALRIRYVAARNMGMFEIVVDGELLDVVDAYATELRFPGTQVYIVGPGPHILTIRSAQQKHPLSEGYVIGLDAIQVFRGTDNLLILPPSEISPTPTQMPVPALSIAQVAAPPTREAPPTPIPPAELVVAVVIAYDENGNRAVDPAEGVHQVPVWLVEVGSNRVIAQTFTDDRGFAQLSVTSSAQLRVVVPYFAQVWDVPRSSSSGMPTSFTLLLEAGNQPGLIP